MILMCLVFLGISRRAAEKILDTKPQVDNSINHVNIDWAKLYPFDEDDSVLPVRAVHMPVRKKSVFAYIKDKIEAYTSEKIAGRSYAIKAVKKYEELIGWNIMKSSRKAVKLRGGFLSDLIESKDVSQNAEAVNSFQKFCRDLNIEFMYINFPGKICISEDEGISGTLDFANQNTDRLLDAIGRAGVRYYDLRKILHAEGMNHHQAFPVVDGHWKPETGFWAAGKILEILKNDYGWPVNTEVLMPDKFEKIIYPKSFNDEDFVLMYPEYPMQVHYEIPSMAIDTIGDFGVMYNIAYMNRKNAYLYGVYNYSVKPLGKIQNISLKDNNKSILIIHDSFANCVIPFLAAGIKNIDEIDLRVFSGSVKSYIKTHRPDAVIVCYFIHVAGMDEFYDFR